MKCRICKGGLFIPLDEHIEIYCKSPDYPQCMQYALHTENRLEISGNLKQSNRNRRKFVRVDVSYKITLVRLINSGSVVSHFSSLAQTLDLSSGGMRLTTNNPLLNNSVIQFSFNDSFPEDLQEGTGLIAWCNKEVDEPGYQAGISFQDEQTVQAMELYLGRHFRDM